MREDGSQPRNRRPKGGQRKPREIREQVLQIARTTGFGYTGIIGASCGVKTSALPAVPPAVEVRQRP